MFGLTAMYLSQLKYDIYSQKPGQSHVREGTIDQHFQIGACYALKKDEMLKLNYKPHKNTHRCPKKSIV